MQSDDVHVVHRARSGGLLSRDHVYALTDADLKAAPGETVGIVGESGCGKSTLAKVLVGAAAPDRRHRVRSAASDLWTMSPAERRSPIGRHTGMIFQDPSTALNRRLPVAPDPPRPPGRAQARHARPSATRAYGS